MYIHIHICTYIYLRARPRAGPWALGRAAGTQARSPAHVRTLSAIYVYVYGCMYMYICMYICVYMYVYMYICVYMYIPQTVFTL